MEGVWGNHKELVEKIYKLSYTSTGHQARKLATVSDITFWQNNETPLLEIYRGPKDSSDPSQLKIATIAMETLEVIKNLHLAIKVALLSTSGAEK
ncbi:MAG: hypothetical protein LBV23_10255 [Deltaproteobacteria bacterium]|nr:hypothetical protein [Deltaproteobacteria bacterium]